MSEDRRRARQLLESSRVVWARDFDAVAIGFVFGLLIGVLLSVAVVLGWTR